MKPGFWKKYLLTVLLVLGLCGLSVQGLAAQGEDAAVTFEEGDPGLYTEELLGEEFLPEAGGQEAQDIQDIQDIEEAGEYIGGETEEEIPAGDGQEEEPSPDAEETLVSEEDWMPVSEEEGTADSEEADGPESGIASESGLSEEDADPGADTEYEIDPLTGAIFDDGELLVGAGETGDTIPIRLQVKNVLKGSPTTVPSCVFGLEVRVHNEDGEYEYRTVTKKVDGESVPSTLTLPANRQGAWTIAPSNKRDGKKYFRQYRITLLEVKGGAVDIPWEPESFVVKVLYRGNEDGSYEVSHVIDEGEETEGNPVITFTGSYSASVNIGLAAAENTETGLPGGVLAIRNSAGTVVKSWKTTEETLWKTVPLEKDDTYTLTELIRPEGRGWAEDIFFTLKDGVIEQGGMAVTDILMTNTARSVRPVSFVVDNLVSGSPTSPAAFTFALQQRRVTAAGTYSYVPVYDLEDNRVIPVRGTIYGSGRETVFTVNAELEEAGDTAEYYVLGATKAAPGYSCDNSRHKVVFTLMKDENGDEWVSARVDEQEETSGDPVLSFENAYGVTVRCGLADSGALTEGLPGGALVLKDSAGAALASWTTAKELWHSETLTKDGRYTLSETAVPDGYTKAEDAVFTLLDGALTLGGETASDVLLTCKPLSGSWSFIDTEAGTIKAVKGAAFELYKIKAEAGSSAWSTAMAKLRKKEIPWSELTRVAEVTTNGKGKASFDKLAANTCYVISQKSVPDTYQLTPKANSIILETKGTAGKFSVSILSDGKGTLKNVAGTLRFLQYPTRVRITSSMGAKLKLVDTKTGKTVKKWTVDCNPTELKGLLRVGRTYKLSMTKAPAGCKKPAAMTFTVWAGKPDSVQSVTYKAKKKK